MAGVNSKLSEVDMVLIYQAKGFFEWKTDLTKQLDWAKILELSGVTSVTADEAEQWVTNNYVERGFNGTDGLLAWLKECLTLKNGLVARHVLSTLPFREIDKNDEGLNNFATERDLNPFPRRFYGYREGMIPYDGGLTGMNNPREINLQFFERWNAARNLYLAVDNVYHRNPVFLDDDAWLQNQLMKYNVEYDGSLDQLKLDLRAFGSTTNATENMRPRDEDQDCAVFLFHRLTRMLQRGIGLTRCRAGLGCAYPTTHEDEEDETFEEDEALQGLVNIAVYQRVLSSRRGGWDWCSWFVNQLFNHPAGCEYFNTNAPTLTRVQFEVLRMSRHNNWFGNRKLWALWELVQKGWLTQAKRSDFFLE